MRGKDAGACAWKKGGKFMVRHLVAWNFKESLSSEEKDEAEKMIQKKLEEAAAAVDGVIKLEVLFKELDSGNRDILLFSEFASQEALNAYQVHPVHLEAKEYIAARTKDRACFDYKTEG